MRAGQLFWVLDHDADVASDMSAIHRVADHLSMPAPRFFAFAHRLPAYRGVMRLRAEEVINEREAAQAPFAAPAAGSPAMTATGGRVEVDATPAALASAGLSGLFEVGGGDG
ncbi:hypothetical protein [Rhizomonospora bruguierae]|uniref:hypothetical protein n=1 Tax=Rhizomonospora bruguierae TaxID=1581705 RepID=UPI001BD0652F|nr:hypothetical protein [Micromonospora sp. NBRC 107566]